MRNRSRYPTPPWYTQMYTHPVISEWLRAGAKKIAGAISVAALRRTWHSR